jgi:hypothetical protein
LKKATKRSPKWKQSVIARSDVALLETTVATIAAAIVDCCRDGWNMIFNTSITRLFL